MRGRRAEGRTADRTSERCPVRVRPRRGVGGSLACIALLLAPAGVGTEWATPTEQAWGGAGEPGLHRLLRDLVRETREHGRCRRAGPPRWPKGHEPHGARSRSRRLSGANGAHQRPAPRRAFAEGTNRAAGAKPGPSASASIGSSPTSAASRSGTGSCAIAPRKHHRWKPDGSIRVLPGLNGRRACRSRHLSATPRHSHTSSRSASPSGRCSRSTAKSCVRRYALPAIVAQTGAPLLALGRSTKLGLASLGALSGAGWASALALGASESLTSAPAPVLACIVGAAHAGALAIRTWWKVTHAEVAVSIRLPEALPRRACTD